MREKFAGGAAKVKGVIDGRVMAHPRQSVKLHTVYNFGPGCQPESGHGRFFRFLRLPETGASS